MRAAGTNNTRVSPRRHLNSRQVDTVEKLLDAALVELRHKTLSGLSIRAVAARADVAPATAYTYFASKEHLATELFWQSLSQVEIPDPRPGATPAERVSHMLSPIAVLAMKEPELASACTTAMLSSDLEVDRIRTKIGAYTHSLLREALGTGATSAQLITIESAWSGFLVRAGMGHIGYEELPGLLELAANVVFNPPAISTEHAAPRSEKGNRP